MAGDVLRKQQREVLNLAAQCWENGVTAYEASVQLGRQQNVMASRLSELGADGFLYRREGRIESKGRVEVVYESRPGGSGRKCDVWRPTQAGLDEARRVLDGRSR